MVRADNVRAKQRELNLSDESIAEYLGISVARWKWMVANADFTSEEADQIGKLFGIRPNNRTAFFYC